MLSGISSTERIANCLRDNHSIIPEILSMHVCRANKMLLDVLEDNTVHNIEIVWTEAVHCN